MAANYKQVTSEKILFVPDAHFPYQDKKAWAIMLRAAHAWRPDRVVVLGDMADFYAVSSHGKDPARKSNLKWEVEELNRGLDNLDGIGAKKKHFVSGNHENRLQRYLADKAPELFDIFDVPSLFNLKKRGWTYTPYGQSYKIGHLFVTHDEGNAGPLAHIKAAQTFNGNVVIGHTHRMGVHYQGSARGESHVGAMFGWLGDLNSIDYMARVRSQQWQHGFGIGRMLANGDVHLQAIPIVNGVCVVEGRVIS